MGRIFFAALETLGTSIAMQIGLANALGVWLRTASSTPSLADFLIFVATTLLFVTDQHLEVIRGLVASYRTLPVASGFGPQFGLIQVADTLSKAFFLGLRVASSFILFGIVFNLAVGVANKLTPQIQSTLLRRLLRWPAACSSFTSPSKRCLGFSWPGSRIGWQAVEMGEATPDAASDRELAK